MEHHMTPIRSAYFRVFGLEVFVEFPSITRGHRFIDWKNDNGEVLIWCGLRSESVANPWRDLRPIEIRCHL